MRGSEITSLEAGQGLVSESSWIVYKGNLRNWSILSDNGQLSLAFIKWANDPFWEKDSHFAERKSTVLVAEVGSCHQLPSLAKSSVRIYSTSHPRKINLPEGLAALVNLVFHPCLGLLSHQGAPGGQDHLVLLASLILCWESGPLSFL